MFKIFNGIPTGYHMTFKNGWTVSVQWGKGNYISNRDNDGTSVDAEVAAWDRNDNWYKFDFDVVKGFMSADEVAEFISMIAAKDP